MLTLDTLKNATNADLLTAVLGQRKAADALLKNVKGSLFRLLHQWPMPGDTADLFCKEVTRGYRDDPLLRLHAARELVARSLREDMASRSALSSPQAVRDYLRLTLSGLAHEVFVVIFLDAQNRVIASEELFRGTLTQTSVYPREIVKRTLHYNAAAVIFAHNHPSGVAEPSRADETLTQTLKHTLSLVDVKVLDHFVIGCNAATSFAERGML